MPLLTEFPEDAKHIHIMGVGGTAMAALAGMLVDAGYTVTGSDGNVIYPPMSDYLDSLGISAMVGFNASNIEQPTPDLVVIGNVVRSSYPEAVAVVERDLPYMSFPGLLGSRFLSGKRSLVIAGTHGKTTTTTVAMWLLESAGRDPGFLVGGVAGNFNRTARAAAGMHFVIEGDEYDTAFFDKGPKFLHYRPQTVILTSIEFDHADIYRDLEHCKQSFLQLMSIMPADGCVVARGDHEVVTSVADTAECEIRRYGPDQEWDGRIDAVDTERGVMTFTVTRDGVDFGTFETTLVGEHNLYNQVAAVAALEREGLSVEALARGFRGYRGVRRRQEVFGEPGGVTLVDDFAHHPTAVHLTLEALRLRFGGRRIWAIFEPRSNTSRRNVFQAQYAAAFDAADISVIAPPQNVERIPPDERMDAQRLVSDIRRRGNEAFLWGTGAESAAGVADGIVANLIPQLSEGDVVAVLSNGGFGGIHQKLLGALQ